LREQVSLHKRPRFYPCSAAAGKVLKAFFGSRLTKNISEVFGLRRDHVNLKENIAILPNTKNHDRRVVPLPPQGVAVFHHHPLPLREWSPGWTLDHLGNQFTKAATEARLTGVTLHTQRHNDARKMASIARKLRK
jgi:integrase